MEIDRFAWRINSYDYVQVQYNVACEELVRNNFGKVNRKSIVLKPLSPECGNLEISSLIVFFTKLGCNVITDNTYVKCFLAKDWVAKMIVEHQQYDSVQIDSTGEENLIRGVQNCIRVVSIEFNALDLGILLNLEENIQNYGFKIVSEFSVDSGVPVTFAFPGMHGIDYYTQSFEGIRLDDICGNYEVGVVDAARELVKYATNVSHGLVLINGPVGTGKSYLIRSILTELAQRRAVVCTPPTQFLVQAGLLTQVVANFRKSILVLEDIGEVVAVDSAVNYQDARANLLNLSEGFLSLLTDAVIIISFNYKLDKIDPAILRPGRCLANIEVRELSASQAQTLVPFELPSMNRKYTLAEIYEMRRVGSTNVKLAYNEKFGLSSK